MATLYSNYGRLFELCNNPITSIASDIKFILPNSSVYYMGDSFYTNEYADNIDSPQVISPKPELLKAVGAHTSDEGQYRYIANSKPNTDLNNGKVKKLLRKKSEHPEAPFYEHFKKSNSCKSCSKEYFQNISEYHRPTEATTNHHFIKI